MVSTRILAETGCDEVGGYMSSVELARSSRRDGRADWVMGHDDKLRYKWN